MAKNRLSQWAKRHNTSAWITHIVVLSLYVTLAFSSSDFVLTPVANANDVIYATLHWFTIFIAFTAVLFVFSLIHRFLLYTVYIVVCLLSAVLTYFKYSIGFSLNTMIFDIVFTNDMRVTADMITAPLIIYVVIATAVGIVLVRPAKHYKINYHHPTTYIILAVAIATSAILLGSHRFQRPIAERIPFNIVFVTSKYVKQREEIAQHRPRQCTYSTATPQDSTIVVVVIGEALRPSNLSINDYHRSTTPLIEELGVISFDSVYSDYVYTNKSIPHLMTRADRTHPERGYNERSFIDIFRCAGIPTTVIANQDAEQQYAYFIHEADTTIQANVTKTVYNFDKWLDGDILPHYQRILSQTNNQLIVIHTIGSHWWYCSHFSDQYAKYQPIMQSRIVGQSDSITIVNSYDNTILYTDYVLSEIIKPLQNRNAIMLYLSDHGEQLGENGKWLHADKSEIMCHTASLLWMSDCYKALHPDRATAALTNRHNRYLTEYLYHTVIEAGNIETDVLEKKQSVFYQPNIEQ